MSRLQQRPETAMTQNTKAHRKSFAAWAAALACLSTLGAAQAQGLDHSRFSARVGITTIMPSVDSGDLSAPSLFGTKIDVGNATMATAGISYAVTDSLHVDLPLGLPFRHKVVGDGAIAGVGTLGTVQALPITMTLQYRFGNRDSLIRPYVGVGGTYARFFRSRGTAALSGLTGGSPARPTTLTMDNASGPALQLGSQIRLDKRWALDVSVTQVRLKTTGTLSTGQTIDARLDPAAVTVAFAHSF